MFRNVLWSLILCMTIVPLAAADTTVEPASLQLDEQVPAAAAARGCAQTVEPIVFKSQPVFTATATCTADCWDGSTVTCSGNQCSATDSACMSEQGSCWSDAEGTKECPECCESVIPCSKYHGRSCTSGTIPCMEGSNCAQCFCGGGTWQCP